MKKLKDLIPLQENKKQINEVKLTAKQMRSDLSNYINKNADKIAKEFIPKGTRYLVEKNSDGISFVIENSDTSKNSKQKELDYISYIQIDVNLGQSSGFFQSNNHFDKATINEGTLASYYSNAESPTKSAARKVDDLLKTLVKDKRQLDKLTDLITDLLDEYAQERINLWDYDKLHEKKINEGTLSNYYSRSESPTRNAAKKVDDLLKTLITDKRQLDKLTDLITDLADEYAEERIDLWDMDKLDEALDDLEAPLPAQMNRFLDKTVSVIKGYNLPRKKEAFVMAKVIDSMGVDKSELNTLLTKIKRSGILNKK